MPILIDTNVLSQPTRPNGSERVVGWIDRHFDDLLVPAIAISELFFGAFRLPDGELRTRLRRAHEAIMLRFADKIVAFDLAAAKVHAELSGEAARVGRPLAFSDSMVAATALTRGLMVATRNTRHFTPTGVALIDPWQS